MKPTFLHTLSSICHYKSGRIYRTAFIAVISCMFMACSDEPDSSRSSLSIIADDGQGAVLVPGYEIEWYDEASSELKFRNVPDKFAEYHGEVTFVIDGKSLFNAFAIVSGNDSRIYTSAVIYRDHNGKYYLNDCYPMIESVMYSSEVLENRKSRAAAMEAFRNQLEIENRLK